MAKDVGSIYFRIFAKTKQMQHDMKQANTTLRKFDRSVKDTIGSVFNLRNAFAALGVGLVVKSLWDAQVVVDQMNRSFKAITGTAEGAKKELAYIRGVANKLGGEFYSLTDSMKYVAAAAKDTTLEGAGVRDIFMAVTEAGVALGLTNVQVKMSLYAISQMISKGTVNAEELRQQLGERLPGAYQAMARALDITTAQLNKRLEQGKVIATEAIPKLAKELHRMYADMAMLARFSPIGMLNRFKTAWMDLKVALGSGDFLTIGSRTLGNFTALLKDPELHSSLTNLIDQFAQIADSAISNAIPFIKGVSTAIDDLSRALGNENLKELAKLALVFKFFGAKGAAFYGAYKVGEFMQDPNLPKDEFERLDRAKKELEEILALQERANRNSLLGRFSPERLQRIQNTKDEIKTIEDKIAMLKKEQQLEASTFYDPRGRHDPSNLFADAKVLRDKLALDKQMVKVDEEAMKKRKKEMEFDADIQKQIEAQNRAFKELEHEEYIENLEKREEQLTYSMGLEGQERARDYQTILDVMEDAHRGWSDIIADLSINTYDKMEDNFSSVFKDIFRGELKTFADYFNSFCYSLLDSWADVMGQMATESIFGKRDTGKGGWISKLFGSAAAGFMGSASGHTTPASVSAGTYGPSMGNGRGMFDLKFGNGGWIGENVIGVGASGRSYQFHGNEAVLTKGQLGGGGANIIINEAANTPEQGTTVENQNMNGIDTYVVNLVAKNIAQNGPIGKTIGHTYNSKRVTRNS